MHSSRLFTTPKFLPTTMVWKEESTQNGKLATPDSTSRCHIYELQLMLDLKGNDVQRLVDRKWLECHQERERDRKRTEHEQRGRR